MAVPVAGPRAQHRGQRPQLVEPGVPGGGARAVMPHLEERHRTHAAPQARLHGQARVAGEHGPEAAVLEEQHHRVLVQVEAPAGPGRIGMQDREPHPVQLEPLAGARRHPAPPTLARRGQEVEVQRIADHRAGLEHHGWIERVQDGPGASQVVGVRVGDHRQLDPPRALATEPGHHHPPAGIAPPVRGARIHEQPPSTGGPERNRVALTDVEEMYPEIRAPISHGPRQERQPEQDRGGPRQAARRFGRGQVAPDAPRHGDREAEPGERPLQAAAGGKVAVGKRSTPGGESLEQAQADAGSRRERGGSSRREGRRYQARHRPGEDEGGERHGHQVEGDPGAGHRPECVRRDGRRKHRGADRRRECLEQRPSAQAPRGPARRGHQPPHRREGHPGARRGDGPRIHQTDEHAGEREQAGGRYAPLAVPLHRDEGEEEGRAGGGRRPAEEPGVSDGTPGRDEPRAPTRHPAQGQQDAGPAGEEADVEARDREEVGEPGAGELVAHAGVHLAAAEDQGVDQRGAGAVERLGRAGGGGPQALRRRGGRSRGPHSRADHERAPGPAERPFPRHPAPLHRPGVASPGAMAGGPVRGDGAAAPGVPHPDFPAAAIGHRIARSDDQRHVARGEPGTTGAGLGEAGRLASQPPGTGADAGQREEGSGSAEDGEEEERDDEDRIPEMREAGRETGPVADGGGERTPRAQRGPPLRAAAALPACTAGRSPRAGTPPSGPHRSGCGPGSGPG